MRHVARRTCIGCRAVDEPDQLVRLTVRTDATGTAVVMIDEGRRLGGRGAWLHPTEQCLQNAVRRKAFNRAFRAPVDADAVVQTFRQVASETAAEHE
ncbi:YlxR family protein [Kocuria coralli]|uniref:YlxR family protein n=1 Tax=Kocuria coralli TaxID=1461025 RepID=A0A5J5KV66_9MICC|nr:YlxR family protein [Kocuria coralli]KAA9393589.1 YlxR family protein [Kocuria coralli]